MQRPSPRLLPGKPNRSFIAVMTRHDQVDYERYRIESGSRLST